MSGVIYVTPSLQILKSILNGYLIISDWDTNLEALIKEIEG